GRRLVSGPVTGKGHDPRATVRGNALGHPTTIGDGLLARDVGRHPDERDVGRLLTQEERATADVDRCARVLAGSRNRESAGIRTIDEEVERVGLRSELPVVSQVTPGRDRSGAVDPVPQYRSLERPR